MNPSDTDSYGAPSKAELAAGTRSLNKQFSAEHKKRVAEITAQLSKCYPAASEDERTLIGLASHDVAIAELVGNAQMLLAKRLERLVHEPKSMQLIARALIQVTDCRNAAAQRVQEVLQAVTTVRTQRSLAHTTHLRRVA